MNKQHYSSQARTACMLPIIKYPNIRPANKPANPTASIACTVTGCLDVRKRITAKAAIFTNEEQMNQVTIARWDIAFFASFIMSCPCADALRRLQVTNET